MKRISPLAANYQQSDPASQVRPSQAGGKRTLSLSNMHVGPADPLRGFITQLELSA